MGLSIPFYGPTTVGTLWVAEGDSITRGTFTNNVGYPNLYALTRQRCTLLSNAAVSGSTLSGNGGNSLQGRASADDALISPNVRGASRYILSVLIGRNDLPGYPGGVSQYLTDVAIYLDARRAAGWKIIICTLLPSNIANYNAARNAFNATAVTWVTAHADAVCDFAADPLIGPDAAADNTTYYLDGTHPTQAGQTIMNAIMRPVVDSLAA